MACSGRVHGGTAAHSAWRWHFLFWLTGGERQVSILPSTRSRLTQPNACERKGRRWASSTTASSIVTVAMVDAAVAAVCSRTTAQ